MRKTYSIVDILKDLNQAFHEGDPAYYRLPETRELLFQPPTQLGKIGTVLVLGDVLFFGHSASSR